MTDYRPTDLPASLDPELKPTAQMLEDAADHIAPEPAFTARLERQLAGAHSRLETHTMLSLRKIAPALIAIAVTVILIFVIEWMIRSLAPQRVPGTGQTPLPDATEPANPTLTIPLTPAVKTYPWRGLSLSVAAALPASPDEVDVYLGQSEPHATLDDVRLLAQRFGIQGGIYQTPGELPGTTDFVVSDGRQFLRIRSAGYLEYMPDVVKAYNNLAGQQVSGADQAIEAFLESHAYTFAHRISWDDFRGAYRVDPLAADGTPLRYEFHSQPMMMVYLSPDGSVLRVMTGLLNVSNDPAGRVGIISAEQALQRLLDPNNTAGVIESMHSASTPLHQWFRSYALDQPLTIYGFVRSMRPVEAGQPPFIQLDGYPLTGETGGLDQLRDPTYLATTGRFVETDGALRFSVDSWQVSQSPEDGLVGTLRRDNDQVWLTVGGEQLMLPDVPADVPMPFENAFVVGTRLDDSFQWKMIDDRSLGGGGGGGGGGIGFHKLNLSGTPVPFPAASPTPVAVEGATQYTVQSGDTLGSIASAYDSTIDALVQANSLSDPGQLAVGQVLVIPSIPSLKPQRVEGLRGMLEITISKQPDGSELVSYGFLAMNATQYALLEGDGLEQLRSYNSRPVDIWGTMQVSIGGAIPTLHVDRFEIPFPDLRVQVLQGTQKLVQLEGQQATLFTTDDGVTYVQLLQGGITGPSLIGNEGDEVLLECVLVPGETYAGYPGLRLFGGMLAIDPKTGLHVTLPISRDKPTVLEMPDIGKQAPPEGATIETIELQHFMSDPRYAVPQPDAQSLYFQPVWRFAGHYSNGDAFEVLIQAARDEFLLPEVEPAVMPG